MTTVAIPTLRVHNPYACCLPTSYNLSHAVYQREAKAVSYADPAVDEDGVSEGGSLSDTDRYSRTASVVPPQVPRPVFRYASVNFRFGSAWFLAPFRTAVDDMVVVEYPGEHPTTHIGLVSCITTAKPLTFYSEGNADPNYLTEEEIASLPRLLRHARDFDRDTKLDLREQDLRSLASAQQVADEMGAPVDFIDAEWMLDRRTVTFLIHAHSSAQLTELADELAYVEGAEVVFTFPSC